MGVDTIKDWSLRKSWTELVDIAHQKLAEHNISLSFESFKNDGSYGKAKAGLPAVSFAFCQDSDRTWVELELKARTVKGAKCSQDELYDYLKTHAKSTGVSPPLRITWNEEDLRSSPRNEYGLDKRIKIYLRKPSKEQWADAMLALAQTFIPVLDDYKTKG